MILNSMKKKVFLITLIIILIIIGILALYFFFSNFLNDRENQDFSNNQNDLDLFNRSIIGLNYASQTKIYEIIDNPDNNETFKLSAEIIKKNINGKVIRLYGYNKELPGPLLKVKQGSLIKINFTNRLDLDTTIHWHGLRVENSNDGVPGMNQKVVKPNESFIYNLSFPDYGIYWYHPHVREDYQQELGLYGNIFVEPNQPILNKVNKEEFIILDDILISQNDIEPMFKNKINQVLMGRFGNILLINGKENYSLNVKKGEIVRFYITNAANARVFNFSISGLKMKLIGSDGGLYEKESFVDSVIISPSERAIMEINFRNSGYYEIKNINPIKSYNLGKIMVLDEEIFEKLVFEDPQENELIIEELEDYKKYISKKPDITLKLSVEFPYMQTNSMINNNMMIMHQDDSGIEWEDTMQGMNFASTNYSVNWKISDEESKESNMNLKYNFKIGDKIKIRINNCPKSMHPMQHPFHLHGQRFLILATDNIPNDNLVWKDSVLVPAGKTVDILVDVTNLGEWMAHCHIAEHLSDEMMFSFNVLP
jgi:FtsP/CotA-like multicopper oxidase with cupredoxin domain